MWGPVFKPSFWPGPFFYPEVAMKKPKKTYKAYVCGTNWGVEMRHGVEHVQFYSSIKALKQHKECWAECGIVQVEIKSPRVVKKGMIW